MFEMSGMSGMSGVWGAFCFFAGDVSLRQAPEVPGADKLPRCSAPPLPPPTSLNSWRTAAPNPLSLTGYVPSYVQLSQRPSLAVCRVIGVGR